MKKTVILLILFKLTGVAAFSQEDARNYYQTIRGVVVDKQTQTPLPGANIVLLGSEPQKGTVSNTRGEFRLENVPTGRKEIMVSFIGYHNSVLKNLIVNSARETVLRVELEEKVETTGEIKVVGNLRKDLVINQMASVSARSFTVEEAGRYAGSRDDVARMAMNFAGVSGAIDSRNDIIVRGNTPGGILWRLEDVDIPNPNHFAASGTTGGPIGMLNNNTLRNSDFFTGAFPAEYANVFSGVFDLNLRDGNNEKYEFLGQIGFNGVELGAEGPFKKGGKSSFVANYRYSTLQVFDYLGISFGTAGIPEYQDLNFKMNFPLKKGKISWFGLAGKSNVTVTENEKDDGDLYSDENTHITNGSSLVSSGLAYSHYHNENTYTKFILSYVGQKGSTSVDDINTDETKTPYYREDNFEEHLSFKTVFNKKLSRQFSNRSGFTIDRYGYQLDARYIEEGKSDWKYLLNNEKSIASGPNLYRTYTGFVYKFSDRFEIKPGLNLISFSLNNKTAFEPRFGMNWKTSPRTSLNFGYGTHSKIQSMATYFLETVLDDGTIVLTNKELDFTKAHHWVLGFDALFTEQLRFKAETYYQYLYDVPVEQTPSSYSILNTGADWGLNTRDFLINEGEGWNYGIELTLEKFYHKNYYFLTTVSLFDSKYTGSDGI
ncbi:MAG: TonB-dependent receptor, partial [Draconibacterium sp.]|nr:TonB-dependent receptor [Draconibacterium sp.]